MSGLSVALDGKSFGEHQVLGPVRFDLALGERAALLGPSGIGKSTLIALIAGTDTSFDGWIKCPPGRLAMVFQQPRLLPWRTLAENIALIPGTGGLARARSLLSEVGLAAAADRHPERCSLGMQRRASLARAMAVEPSLILLDEPLVSLDSATSREMRVALTAVFERTKATVLIATHDRREALALADRVLELDDEPARLIADRTSPLDRTARLDPSQVEALHADWYGG